MAVSKVARSSDISSTPPTPVNSASSSIQLDDIEHDDGKSTSSSSAEDSDESDSSVGTVQLIPQLPLVVPTMVSVCSYAVSIKKIIAPRIFWHFLLMTFWIGWNGTKLQQFIINGQMTIRFAILLFSLMAWHGSGCSFIIIQTIGKIYR